MTIKGLTTVGVSMVYDWCAAVPRCHGTMDHAEFGTYRVIHGTTGIALCSVCEARHTCKTRSRSRPVSMVGRATASVRYDIDGV